MKIYYPDGTVEPKEDYCIHDYDTDIQLLTNPPKYRCKKCGELIYVHVYEMIQLQNGVYK